MLTCAVLVAVCIAAACASSLEPAPPFPPRDISGAYLSDAPAGPLGTLRLDLEWDADFGVFLATLRSQDNTAFGRSAGWGTLGGDHLVLNLDRSSPLSYYIQARVELSGETVTALTGTVIFADQAQALSVRFVPLS